jgi:hypothetical protein
MAPLVAAHEAVTLKVSVDVISRDRPGWVDAYGLRVPRAQSIERDDDTVGSAHVPVKYVARINILSSNRTCRIDAID